MPRIQRVFGKRARIPVGSEWTFEAVPGSEQAAPPQDSASVERRIRTRRMILASSAACAAVGAAFLALDGGTDHPSRLARVPAMDSTPGGQRQRESERYQERLRSANEANAEEARRSGRSHIPIPEDLTESRVRDFGDSAARQPQPEDLPAEPEPPAGPSATHSVSEVGTADSPAERRAAAVGPAAQAPSSSDAESDVQTTEPKLPEPSGYAAEALGGGPLNERRVTAIIAQMNAIARGIGVSPPKSEILLPNSGGVPVGEPPRAADRLKSADGAGARNDAAAPAAQPGGIGTGAAVPSGSILYGQVVNSVDSDNPGPVVAEIIDAPLEGHKLIGRIAAAGNGSGFAVSFDTLVRPDGAALPVAAIALDGLDGSSTVASRTDRRILERYGALFVSTFVSEYARSAGSTGSSTIIADGSVVSTSAKPSRKESLHAALGSAGAQLAADLAANAPRGPRTVLLAGHPIGILFLETARPSVGHGR